jgi:hypothetical protein
MSVPFSPGRPGHRQHQNHRARHNQRQRRVHQIQPRRQQNQPTDAQRVVDVHKRKIATNAHASAATAPCCQCTMCRYSISSNFYVVRACVAHCYTSNSVPCPAVPCPALPGPALPCLAVPCRALPCRAVPCPALLILPLRQFISTEKRPECSQAYNPPVLKTLPQVLKCAVAVLLILHREIQPPRQR